VKEHSSKSNSNVMFCPILYNIVVLISDKLSASIRLPRHKRIHDGDGTAGSKGFLERQTESERAILEIRDKRGSSYSRTFV